MLSRNSEMLDPQLHMTESYGLHSPDCTAWMLQGHGVRAWRMLQVEV